jgi:hypothetical protein
VCGARSGIRFAEAALWSMAEILREKISFVLRGLALCFCAPRDGFFLLIIRGLEESEMS